MGITYLVYFSKMSTLDEWIFWISERNISLRCFRKILGTLPIFDFIKKLLLDNFQIEHIIMKKNIYSNINNTDALESFFECITSCSINSEGIDCTTSCYAKHLEPNNVDFPLKFI